MHLEVVVRIKKEIGKRQLLELREYPVNTVIYLKYFTQSSYIPQSQCGRKTTFLTQRASFCLSKTSCSHTLGQTILLYNFKEVRICLNSLTSRVISMGYNIISYTHTPPHVYTNSNIYVCKKTLKFAATVFQSILP